MQLLFCGTRLIESGLMVRRDQTENARPPEAYEPPKVMRVSLRPEEAVLGHCKIAGSSGPFAGSGCQNGLGLCHTPGS
jgi:hypothetical protein